VPTICADDILIRESSFFFIYVLYSTYVVNTNDVLYDPYNPVNSSRHSNWFQRLSHGRIAICRNDVTFASPRCLIPHSLPHGNCQSLMSAGELDWMDRPANPRAQKSGMSLYDLRRGPEMFDICLVGWHFHLASSMGQ